MMLSSFRTSFLTCWNRVMPVLFLVSCIFVSPSQSSAQVLRLVPIRAVVDNIVISTDTFGVHPNATYCIDGTLAPGLTESELAPPLFDGSPDFRFVGQRPGFSCLGFGLRLHIQEWGKLDTFQIKANTGLPFTLKWPSGLATQGWETLVLRDLGGGSIYNVDMKSDTMLDVSLVTSLNIIGKNTSPSPYQRLVPITGVNAWSQAAIDTFGVHESATYCLDGELVPGVSELELPPPILENFDCRFVGHRTGFSCLGMGVRVHLQEVAKLDTFELAFYPRVGGYPFTLTWPSGLAAEGWGPLTIRDTGGGSTYLQDMLTNTSLVVTDSSVKRLFIIGKNSQNVPNERLVIVKGGWNMVSIPLILSDYRASVAFPTAISRAYLYDGVYTPRDTLSNRVGYWLKFANAEILPLEGDARTLDTFDVKAGWNLIGSISSPVPVKQVISDPPGMTTSRFFGFAGTYVPSDTIRPGSAYWVKASETGKLVLSSSPIAAPLSTRIHVAATSEFPPFPPQLEASNPQPKTPNRFALDQNYPNPFNPSTTISYWLPENSYVSLKIYDVLGKEVLMLVEGMQTMGYKTLTLDGSKLSSGIYFYKLRAGSFMETKKMIISK